MPLIIPGIFLIELLIQMPCCWPLVTISYKIWFFVCEKLGFFDNFYSWSVNWSFFVEQGTPEAPRRLVAAAATPRHSWGLAVSPTQRTFPRHLRQRGKTTRPPPKRRSPVLFTSTITSQPGASKLCLWVGSNLGCAKETDINGTHRAILFHASVDRRSVACSFLTVFYFLFSFLPVSFILGALTGSSRDRSS